MTLDPTKQYFTKYTDSKLGSGFTGVNSGKTVTEIMDNKVDASGLTGSSSIVVAKAASATTAASAGSVAWGNVTGKPSEFTPSSHSHAISDVTNLQTTLDGKSGTGHTHDDRYYKQTDLTGSSTTVVVASSGTFVKNSAATWNVKGINGVPSGWIVRRASS